MGSVVNSFLQLSEECFGGTAGLFWVYRLYFHIEDREEVVLHHWRLKLNKRSPICSQSEAG